VTAAHVIESVGHDALRRRMSEDEGLATQALVAKATRLDQTTVSKILRRRWTPGARSRAMFEVALGIPAGSWDIPAPKAPEPPTSVSSPQVNSMSDDERIAVEAVALLARLTPARRRAVLALVVGDAPAWGR
jgi:transcriptional regulator with XRE-family HTH domain